MLKYAMWGPVYVLGQVGAEQAAQDYAWMIRSQPSCRTLQHESLVQNVRPQSSFRPPFSELPKSECSDRCRLRLLDSLCPER